jgi:hypothetical protein
VGAYVEPGMGGSVGPSMGESVDPGMGESVEPGMGESVEVKMRGPSAGVGLLARRESRERRLWGRAVEAGVFGG